jgi:hypothetical protein
LAKKISEIGYQNDQAYFYLGVSAAKLGYRNAARTYFSLSNESRQKCARPLDVCDGINVPQESLSWITLLNNADARDSAKREEMKIMDAAAKREDENRRALAKREAEKLQAEREKQQQRSDKPVEGSSQPKPKNIQENKKAQNVDKEMTNELNKGSHDANDPSTDQDQPKVKSVLDL